MSNSARPKRAAEDYLRTLADDPSALPDSKKPRFDVRNPSALAPDAREDDAVLDADVIGAKGQQVRRNAVNIDGYDSDSENEGFDARVEAKAKEKEKEAMRKEKDEDDMFGDLEEDFQDDDDNADGEARTGTGKKKAVRFLNEDEIEGQVKNSTSGGHVSADFSMDASVGKQKGRADEAEGSDSDSDVDDEVRASTGAEVDEEIGAGGKKTHAPKLDAFNMRNEQEEGRFDDQGNYVRKGADPDAVHDTWLEGVSKKDMRKAKEAADRRDEERRRKAIEDDSVQTADVLKTLIPFLERGETVLEALARLGKGRKSAKPKWQIKNKNKYKIKRKQNGTATEVEMDEDMEGGEGEEGEDPAEAKRRADVEAITGAADLLFTRGQPEIYDAERELLVRQFRRETGEDWVDLSEEGANVGGDGATKMWEYRWSDARDGGDIHGPYDGETMVQWNEAGYFGEGVEFRHQDTEVWSQTVDFV